MPVHPAPIYEAIAAFAIAGVLWSVRRRWHPAATVGSYAVLTGTARFLVGFVRINDEAVFGLTQPQLWSIALVLAGAVLFVFAVRRPGITQLWLSSHNDREEGEAGHDAPLELTPQNGKTRA